jgi:MFS family permease
MALTNENHESTQTRLTNLELTKKDSIELLKCASLKGASGTMRLNRFAVSAFFIMHGLCFASWASRIPSIQEKLNLSASALGSVLFALPLGFFVSLPFTGWLIGRIGSKKVVVTSSILYSLSLVLIGASERTLSLVVSLFLLGFFANQLNISINTQAVFVERLYKKRLMATFHGLWSVAGFAGAAIGTGMISKQVAPINHFLFIWLVFVIVTAIAAYYLVKKDEVASEKRPFFLMPDRSLIGLGLIAFCSMIAEGAMFDWSGIYFSKVVQVDPQLTGIGYTTFMIAMAATRFLADGFSNRFGLRIILQMSGLLTTIGLLLSVLFPSMIPSLMGFFIVGIGVSSVVPMVYSAAGKSNTLSAGAALTAVSSLGFMGFLIGPPIIGFIAEASSLRISFLAITVMSLSVVVLASAMPNRAKD